MRRKEWWREQVEFLVEKHKDNVRYALNKFLLLNELGNDFEALKYKHSFLAVKHILSTSSESVAKEHAIIAYLADILLNLRDEEIKEYFDELYRLRKTL